MMFGGLMYLASSMQGSFEALRSVNAVTHFTHYTVGHAHLGAYGFVTMVLFGAHLLHDAAGAELGVAVSEADHACSSGWRRSASRSTSSA